MTENERLRTEEKLRDLAEACLTESKNSRRELTIPQGYGSRLAEKYGLKRLGDLDQLLADRMAAGRADASAVLKIRYWRTGRHVPVGREQAAAFGTALELSEAEMDWLIREYLFRSDRVFTAADQGDPLWQQRKELLAKWSREYLEKISPGRMLLVKISPEAPEPYLRHLYFMDALEYTCGSPELLWYENHGSSSHYDAEFRRQMNLFGEISRSAMLRHLFLFGMPFLNASLLSERLEQMGYAGLREERSTPGGARIDALVMGLLALYEEACQGQDPSWCLQWMKSACCYLDKYLRERNRELRFLYFKALKKGEEIHEPKKHLGL